MITGVVTVDREAIIRLTIHGPTGQQDDIEALIDTGFDGWLSLPPTLIAHLGLIWRRRGRAILADGTTRDFDIYQGDVIWDGQPCRMVVDEADTLPLVGMAMLEDAFARLGGTVHEREPRRYEITRVPTDLMQQATTVRDPILRRYERVTFEKDLVTVPGKPLAELSDTYWLLVHPDLKTVPRVRLLIDWIRTSFKEERSALQGLRKEASRR